MGLLLTWGVCTCSVRRQHREGRLGEVVVHELTSGQQHGGVHVTHLGFRREQGPAHLTGTGQRLVETATPGTSNVWGVRRKECLVMDAIIQYLGGMGKRCLVMDAITQCLGVRGKMCFVMDAIIQCLGDPCGEKGV